MTCDLGHYDVVREACVGIESYLEIGVQDGASLAVVLENAPDLKILILSDEWGFRHGGTGRGNHKHIERLISAHEFIGDVQFLDGPSQTTIPLLTESCDLVHVDGGHSYMEALTDIMNVWPLTRKRMIIHDISFPDVWKAICAFTFGNATSKCSFGDEGTIVFERMIDGKA